MLRKIWEGWKVVAEKIGNFQARLILSLLYFVLIGPVALVRRVVADPLRLRRGRHETYWIPRGPVVASLDEARRQ